MSAAPQALIVEDDDRIIEQIEDTLFSLGHGFQRAASQAEARQKLEAQEFDYVLLDLHIPVRSGRGGASAENGLHLLRTLRQSKAPAAAALPVVIMTGQGAACVDLMSELHRYRPDDYISKPWPDRGRTLAKVIATTLDRRQAGTPVAADAPPGAEPQLLQPFEGGELVVRPERVELCGVTIVSHARSPLMYGIIKTLADRVDGGRYRALSGEQLAEILGCSGGQGSIAGRVRDLRKLVWRVMAAEAAMLVGQGDLIETVNSGYRLNNRVVVGPPPGGC